MSSYCLSNECVNGNCPGCKNGMPYCEDPRCFPNCPNCPNSNSSSNGWGWWWYIIIIIVIIIIIIFLFFALRRRKPVCSKQPVTQHQQVIYELSPEPIIQQVHSEPMMANVPVQEPIMAAVQEPIITKNFIKTRKNPIRPYRAPTRFSSQLDESLNIPSPSPVSSLDFSSNLPILTEPPMISAISEPSEFIGISPVPQLPELNPVPDIPQLPDIPPISENNLTNLRNEAVLEPSVFLSPTPIVQKSSIILPNVSRASLPPPEKLSAVPSSISSTKISNLNKSLRNGSITPTTNLTSENDIIRGF